MNFFESFLQMNTPVLDANFTDMEQDLLSSYIQETLLSSDINEFLNLCRQSNYNSILFSLLDSAWECIENKFIKSEQYHSSSYYDALYTFTLCRCALLEESIRKIITTHNKSLFQILVSEKAFEHHTEDKIKQTLNDIWLELEDRYQLNDDTEIIRYKKDYQMVEYMKQELTDTPYITNDVRHLQHVHWLQ